MWQNDKKNGKGKLTYTDGSIFDGTFLDDQPDGYGMMMFYNGDRY